MKRFKKLISVLLVIGVVTAIGVPAMFAAPSAVVSAYDEEIFDDRTSGMKYRVSSEEDAEAYLYDGTMFTQKTLIVPSEATNPTTGKKYKVVGIDDNAFDVTNTTTNRVLAKASVNSVNAVADSTNTVKDMSSLVHIIINDNIKYIGKKAFYGCSNASDIQIKGNNVEYIGESAFIGTAYYDFNSGKWDNGILYIGNYLIAIENYKSVNRFPGGVLEVREGTRLIADSAAVKNTLITGFVFPKSLRYIGNSAFWGTTEATTIEFEEGSELDTIYDYAFNCSGFVTVDLPEGTRHIGMRAFYSNENMASVTLPKSIESIGESAFANCRLLTKLTVPYDANLETIGNNAFANANIEKLFLPANTRKIGYRAFYQNKQLSQVILSMHLESLGDYAFAKETIDSNDGYVALDTVYLPTYSVGKLGYKAFANCSSNMKLYVPPSYIDEYKAKWNLEQGTFEELHECEETEFVTTTNEHYRFKCCDANCYYGFNKIIDNEEPHEWDDGEVTKEATCTTDGEKTYKCKGCGYTKTEAIEKLDHTYDEGEVTTEPTCTAKGVKTYKCTECGQTKTEPIATTAHTFSTAWSKNATQHWHACTGENCSAKSGTANHSWDSGTVTKQPTYNDYGVKTYTCTVCKATKTENVAKKVLPKVTVSSAANAANAVQIKWNKVTGAQGYKVYRKTGSGSYAVIATVNASTTAYNDTRAANGYQYTYAVRAYNGKAQGAYTAKACFRLTRPTISSAQNTATRRLTVKWNKNAKATGYQIMYKTGTATKYVTVKGGSVFYKTITNLTKGKTYSVYVRSYRTVGGVNYYSAWSAYKNTRITK